MKWIESTIGEVCDIGGGEVKTGPFGSQLHQSDYSTFGTPVVMPKDIIDGDVSEASIARVGPEHVERLSKHKLNDGDIVYGRRGDIGRQALITKATEGWLCGTGCLRVTIGDSAPVIPMFLHLYLRQNDVISWIANQAVGATMPNLNTSILRSVPVRFPESPSHQKELSEVIYTYDALIENNNRRIAILEEIAQSLYREWFVKFRFPGHEQCQMVDSPLGPIPDGWYYQPADKLFTINIGKTPPRKESHWFTTSDQGVKWISIRDMGNSGLHVLDTNERLTKQAVQKFKVKVIPKNTVVMSFKLTVGKVSITTEDMATNEAIAHFNLNGNSFLSNEYLSLYLKNFSFQTLGNTSSIGNAINSKIVKGMPILVADESLINKFTTLLAPVFLQLEQLAKSNRNLRTQRELILPKLISGKINLSPGQELA